MKINESFFLLKKLEKIIKPEKSRRKESIKIKVEINELEI